MRRAPFFCILLVSGASACAPKAQRIPPAHADSSPVTISIFGTNDVHGELRRLPFLAGYVDVLRKKREADGGVVLVDAGDAFQGTLESNSNEGAAVIAAFNDMGYAAMALGNHEFDFGPEGPRSVARAAGDEAHGALRARIREAHFPVLAANLVGDDGRLPAWSNLRGSALVDVRGVRVGIVGLLTRETEEVVKRPLFAGLHTTPLGRAAIDAARGLRQNGADLVVVAAHAGGVCTRFEDPNDLSSCAPDGEIFRFARELPPGLVDVVVAGHVNAGVAHVVAGIPIVQAPSHLISFSRVDVTFDRAARRVLETHVLAPRDLCRAPLERGCDPGPYEGVAVVPDEHVAAAVRPALDAARALAEKPLGARVVATLPVAKGGEVALGNLFADLMREAVPGADAAFTNAGSIRDELPAGDLTYGKLFHVMPFDNQMSRVRLTGAELAALLLHNLTQKGHGMLSVSGIVATVTCKDGNPLLSLARSTGEKIRDDQMLTVATSDFLALGGDGLLESLKLPEGRIDVDTGKTAFEALAEGLAKRREIRPDDPSLEDPAHPRLRLPGPFPVTCEAPSR